MAVAFDDQRPESAVQLKMQEMADASAQVLQLMAYQEMADVSPQVAYIDSVQMMADAFIKTLSPVDRKNNANLNISSEPIQRLTDENLEAIKEEIITHGYNTEELKAAIIRKIKEEVDAGISRKLTKTKMKRQLKQIHASILEESYTRLYRTQDELDHNVPRGSVDEENQGDGSGATLWNQAKDDLEELGLIGMFAAGHTYGLKDTSSFVSLAKDVEALAQTTDKGTGKENVSNVIENAKYLCEYWVPKEYTWTPEEMLDRINTSSLAGESMFGGDMTTPEEWLPGPPTAETEVLYYGYDLDKYMTGSGINPYKR